MRLRIEQQDVNGGSVLHLAGEIDLSTTDILADALAQADAATIVVADLTGVTFLDSTGINTLLRAHHGMVAQGHRLALASAQPAVLRPLHITGVDTVIPLYPTVPNALRP